MLYNTGDGGWSVARSLWEGVNRLAIRWNGITADENEPSHPTRVPNWLMLPVELEGAVLAQVEELKRCDNLKRRVKERFAKLPKNLSLAEELIAERRAAAQQESGQ